MPGMILLKPGNRILEECFRSQIMAEDGKREAVDIRLCDFDDISYRVTVEKDDLETMKVSMGCPCWHDIKDKGGELSLKSNYGDWTVDPETGYEISLNIKIPEIKDKDAAIDNLQLMKSKIVGSVFDYYLSGLQNGEKREKHKFSPRGDTEVFFVPGDDRCVIIFTLDFSEAVDKEIAKVFLSELQSTRKKMQQAPPTAWFGDGNVPMEIRDNFGDVNGGLGFLSFAVLKSNVKSDKHRAAIVDTLQSFRTFLQYHIKASKTHFNNKMRKRVVELQKVLNRAKEVEGTKKEKKTAGGKTFKRS